MDQFYSQIEELSKIGFHPQKLKELYQSHQISDLLKLLNHTQQNKDQLNKTIAYFDALFSDPDIDNSKKKENKISDLCLLYRLMIDQNTFFQYIIKIFWVIYKVNVEIQIFQSIQDNHKQIFYVQVKQNYKDLQE